MCPRSSSPYPTGPSSLQTLLAVHEGGELEAGGRKALESTHLIRHGNRNDDRNQRCPHSNPALLLVQPCHVNQNGIEGPHELAENLGVKTAS
jgi:hypothetical protein